MNNEEILKAAQSQKNKSGEYEKNIGRRAVILASIVWVIVCGIMLLVELIGFKKLDFGKPALFLCFAAVMNLYEGIITKTKRMIIIGVIEAIVSVLFLVLYVGALFL